MPLLVITVELCVETPRILHYMHFGRWPQLTVANNLSFLPEGQCQSDVDTKGDREGENTNYS